MKTRFLLILWFHESIAVRLNEFSSIACTQNRLDKARKKGSICAHPKNSKILKKSVDN